MFEVWLWVNGKARRCYDTIIRKGHWRSAKMELAGLPEAHLRNAEE